MVQCSIFIYTCTGTGRISGEQGSNDRGPNEHPVSDFFTNSFIMEAMYYCTPVITSRYQEFEESFGTELAFGYYCEENTSKQVARLIEKIMESDESQYQLLCRSAHSLIDNCTWDAWVDRMIQMVTSKEQKK